MLINLDHISKNFGSKTVLKDASFQLNPDEKVGLVGRNGTGKTTLFRLIAGGLEPDSGQIVRQPQVRLGFMKQLTHVEPERTVFESAVSVFAHMEERARELESLEAEIESKSQHSDLNSLLERYGHLQTRWEMEGGYSYEARTKAVLFGLGFEERELEKSAAVLSGGELNRLNLAKLLLSDPNLLLLDEPTNHLDISAVRWLEGFLKDYTRAFVVISHDRYFLDATVSRILEIADGKVEEYSGNYSQYTVERERRRELRLKAYTEQQEMIARTEEFIRRNLAGQKTKQAKSRRNMLERMDRLERVSSGKRPARFRFDLNSQSGDLVFKLTKVAVGYDGKVLAKNISGSVFRGRNVGIMGPNGSGKSTLLKTLLARQMPLAGKIQVGQKVELAYYDQQLSTLDPEATVLEELRAVSPLATDETLRGYLARFLFFGDDVFHKTGSLSGGEKSRLALAKLIFGKANTLLLDEPTNHLDIPSCEALEEALQDFPGTMIMVSHDRYLLNKLADQILFLDGEGNCTWFDGTYEEFAISQEGPKELPAAPKPAPRATPATPEKPSSNGQKFSKNELAKLKSRCEFLEQEIQRVEGLIESNSSQLSDPELARDFVQFKQLTDCHEDLSARL
ncbi:MAG: ATP-binding cassette domain-containing protein, partial [Acidobacteria bacterium]|nr:ATP-binding cassette domain-containing protein [Acidobacteriota bacterium]